MQEFTASRLSEGNKLFPPHIIIDDSGVTLKVPGFFSGKETTILFDSISSVDIETPFIGFSTIGIETKGEGKIIAKGFTKSEVAEMKQLILDKMKKAI
jgi:hypothetical protein